jgi:putative FmdB family regulatory protein
MPTYDFKCKDCDKDFTVQVSIKDKAKVVCPKCGSKGIEQRFTRINIGGISAGNGGGSSCSGGSCGSCSGC